MDESKSSLHNVLTNATPELLPCFKKAIVFAYFPFFLFNRRVFVCCYDYYYCHQGQMVSIVVVVVVNIKDIVDQ